MIIFCLKIPAEMFENIYWDTGKLYRDKGS